MKSSEGNPLHCCRHFQIFEKKQSAMIYFNYLDVNNAGKVHVDDFIKI